jgi:hypothetical protein
MDLLRLAPPWWWEPGLTLVEEGPDRAFPGDAGRIWILAWHDGWFGKPKPFVFDLQSRLMVYELVMALDERHPYSRLGDRAQDEGRRDIRLAAISLSPRCQKFFDTIIRAFRAQRLKSEPASWSEETDETRLTLIVADGVEVILDELADELAALGDGSVIGLVRIQRDTATAERKRQENSDNGLTAPHEATNELAHVSRSKLNETIRAVYDEAESKQQKPPNLNEIVKPVKDRLIKESFEATGREIQAAAGAKEFAQRRLAAGAVWANSKKAGQNVRK